MPKRCRNCGYILDNNDRFCMKCGAEYTLECVGEDKNSSFSEVWIVLFAAMVVMILTALIFPLRSANTVPEGTWFCESNGTIITVHSERGISYTENGVVYSGTYNSNTGYKGYRAQVMNEEGDDGYTITFSQSGDSMIVYKNVSGNRAVYSIYVLKEG